jgi:hypothetical protein
LIGQERQLDGELQNEKKKQKTEQRSKNKQVAKLATQFFQRPLFAFSTEKYLLDAAHRSDTDRAMVCVAPSMVALCGQRDQG